MAAIGDITFDVILKARGMGVEANVGTLTVPLTMTSDGLDVDSLRAWITTALQGMTTPHPRPSKDRHEGGGE